MDGERLSDEAKRCCRCGCTKPIAEFGTRKRRGTAKPRDDCKACRRVRPEARGRQLEHFAGCKRCSVCVAVKPRDDFGAHAKSPDGLREACRQCRAARESPRTIAREAFKYKTDPAVRLRKIRTALKWRAENRDYFERWMDSPERRALARSKSLAHSRTPKGREQARARDAVRYALSTGKLAKLPCTRCGSTKSVHGHHHRGYEYAHRLDVIWLCAVCHAREHHNSPEI